MDGAAAAHRDVFTAVLSAKAHARTPNRSPTLKRQTETQHPLTPQKKELSQSTLPSHPYHQYT